MRKLTILAGLLGLAVLCGGTPSQAFSPGGAWCLRYDIGNGVSRENCEFRTFDACAQERFNWGSTAFCATNPGFAGYAPAPVRKKRRHPH